MSRLIYLVIHCTDTPDGRSVSRKDIEKWHLAENGWSKVGYSDMIHLDGRLENLVPFNQDGIVDNWEITNGAKGYNGKARHVVYVGGANGVDTRTWEQEKTLETYVKYMILRHPNILVVGHNQLSEKKCPSFNVNDWLKSICVSEKNMMI